MSTKKIVLRSTDGQVFEVDEAVALGSKTIKHMIDDACAGGVIPFPNVTGEILSRVIEYLKKHVEEPNADHKEWDSVFVDVDQDVLLDLVLAANYLDIGTLLDLTCRKVAGMIEGKTAEEIRKTFNIKNDFTPEEEEEIIRENQWAFQ